MHRTERIRQAILSRKAAAIAAGVWIVIILGCMSISIGGRHVTTAHLEDGSFVQEGKVHIPPGCEQDVYYPIPYCCPPNLEIDCAFHQCTIVEQKEDHFRVSNPGLFPRTLEWTARGVKGPPPPLPPAGSTLPPPTPLPPALETHPGQGGPP